MDNTPEPKDPTLPDTTEQRIFDAAHQVFVQKGMDGAKMQEIADRAGINKALLHYYYRTKEKLYETVAKAVINRAIPTIQKMIESDEPLREKTSRFIDFYIDLISKNPFIPLFIIGELNRHPERFFENIFPKELPKPEVFLKQVEDEIAAGNIRAIPPRHLLVNVISMCVFPFVARPMLRLVLGMSQAETAQFLSERKEEVKRFVFAALQP